MSALGTLDPDRTALVVVDLQERFAGAIDGWDSIVGRAEILARAADMAGLPTIVTEQYPEGLGPTVAPVADATGGVTPLTKKAFPATRAEGFDLSGRTQALLCGVETHVCVLQTALDLISSGVEVHLVLDATGSRKAVDRDTAIDRMALAGAVPTTVETAGFELFGSADHPSFRDFQGLIK